MLIILSESLKEVGSFMLENIATFITVFLAGGSAIISIGNNKKTLKQQEELNDKNFEGSIVSKARIEWIQEVRIKSVDFISACHDFFRYIKVSNEGNSGNKQKLIELKSDIEKNGTLLMLYFGSSKDHNENNDMIICLITNLVDKITNKDGWYDENHILALDVHVYVLRDFLRIYFKAEWMRANRGISDDDIQKYLENDIIYEKIMKIYANALYTHEEWVENFYSQIEENFNRG